jgi:hypothetical protein
MKAGIYDLRWVSQTCRGWFPFDGKFAIAKGATICALLTVALAGCISNRTLDTHHSTLISIGNRQLAIGNFPPAMVFALEYSTPLTNCYLESSPDLLHWTVRDDFWIGTNADGTTYWNVRADKSNPREFYRIGGEAIQ